MTRMLGVILLGFLSLLANFRCEGSLPHLNRLSDYPRVWLTRRIGANDPLYLFTALMHSTMLVPMLLLAFASHIRHCCVGSAIPFRHVGLTNLQTSPLPSTRCQAPSPNPDSCPSYPASAEDIYTMSPVVHGLASYRCYLLAAAC